ncbi:type II toxin-antitoxin system RelE family toxin [Desulfoscipio gibsoniae]
MWQVEYIKEAVEDLKRLDYSQRLLVLKAIDKVSNNPLPQTEGGYGKPLGNRNNTRLAGYLKIKLKKPGLRVVYKLGKGK